MKELESEVEFCRKTMKSWEKLRLLYNGVLLLPGIALLWRILHLQAERMAQNPPGMGFPIMDPGGPVCPCPAFWDLCERMFLSRAL